jgi:hypothetical protein
MNGRRSARYQLSMRFFVAVLCVVLVACGSTSKPAEAPASAMSSCNSVDDCAAEVARDPADPRLRIRWAKSLETAGRAAMAAREFRAAIRLATDAEAPVDDAAEGLVRLGDPAGCVSELDGQLASAERMPTLAAVLRRARARCAAATK